MDFGYYLISYRNVLVLSLCYCVIEILAAHKVTRQFFPIVGRPSSLIPRFILNLLFAFSAENVLTKGYQRFKHQAFQFIRNDGSVLVLPLDVIDELSSLPPSVASPNGALEHDLLGPFTGLDLILESRMHHSIVQRKLTPRLGALTPALEQELVAALDDYLPSSTNWTEIGIYQALGKVSARLSARTLVGSALCRNEIWLDISVNYVENLFQTIVVLRLFPAWTHSVLCYLLPSYWWGHSYIRKAKVLLGPRIVELLRKSDTQNWTPDDEEDSNVLFWLADAAKGLDRRPAVLAHVEVLLALASVHTTLLRMVNVLYDLAAAGPELISELRAEIDGLNPPQMPSSSPTAVWPPSSYARLEKLDSVLRESQRLSPPTILGMKRLFHQPYTFANGLHIPEGAYVCMPTYAIENDATHTPNPGQFDGLRSWRLRQDNHEAGSQDQGKTNEDNQADARDHDAHRFTTAVDPTALNFGYGKSACPGRFFAALVLKMLFVKLLTEYEWRFVGEGQRPGNMQIHEFLFPSPWGKILMRKREGEAAPF